MGFSTAPPPYPTIVFLNGTAQGSALVRTPSMAVTLHASGVLAH